MSSKNEKENEKPEYLTSIRTVVAPGLAVKILNLNSWPQAKILTDLENQEKEALKPFKYHLGNMAIHKVPLQEFLDKGIFYRPFPIGPLKDYQVGYSLTLGTDEQVSIDISVDDPSGSAAATKISRQYLMSKIELALALLNPTGFGMDAFELRRKLGVAVSNAMENHRRRELIDRLGKVFDDADEELGKRLNGRAPKTSDADAPTTSLMTALAPRQLTVEHTSRWPGAKILLPLEKEERAFFKALDFPIGSFELQSHVVEKFGDEGAFFGRVHVPRLKDHMVGCRMALTEGAWAVVEVTISKSKHEPFNMERVLGIDPLEETVKLLAPSNFGMSCFRLMRNLEAIGAQDVIKDLRNSFKEITKDLASPVKDKLGTIGDIARVLTKSMTGIDLGEPEYSSEWSEEESESEETGAETTSEEAGVEPPVVGAESGAATEGTEADDLEIPGESAAPSTPMPLTERQKRMFEQSGVAILQQGIPIPAEQQNEEKAPESDSDAQAEPTSQA